MRLPLLALAVAAAALSGCGVGPGATSGTATITISRDFGHKQIGGVQPVVRSSDTVMRALQRSFRVTTRYGGGFVQSIDGLAGGHSGGRPVDWFFYVNGIEAGKGAASTRLRAGDRIIWDFHDWSATQSVPAIVGSFPEPFLRGSGGKRRPVRLECARERDPACAEVERRLRAHGILVAFSAPGTSISQQVLRVVVGPWAAVTHDATAGAIAQGPAASGVFVRPAKDGRTFAVLDPHGAVAARLGAGTGLVAATRKPNQQPTWVVTGTDEAGVLAAARSLTPAKLGGRFAVVIAGGRVTPAPEVRT